MSEFEAVAGKCTDNADIEEKGLKVIRDFDLQALLVTRSEQGMSLLRRDSLPCICRHRRRKCLM